MYHNMTIHIFFISLPDNNIYLTICPPKLTRVYIVPVQESFLSSQNFDCIYCITMRERHSGLANCL